MADQFNIDELDDVNDETTKDAYARLAQLEKIGRESKQKTNQHEEEPDNLSPTSRNKKEPTGPILKNVKGVKDSAQEKFKQSRPADSVESPFMNKVKSVAKIGSAFLGNKTIYGAVKQIQKQRATEANSKKTPFKGVAAKRANSAKISGATARLKTVKQKIKQQEKEIAATKTIGKTSGAFIGKVASRAGKFGAALFKNKTIAGAWSSSGRDASNQELHHGEGNAGSIQPMIGASAGSTMQQPTAVGNADFLYQDNQSDQISGGGSSGQSSMIGGIGDKNVGAVLSKIYQILAATHTTTMRMAEDISYMAKNTRAGQTQSDLFNANVKARINEHPEIHAHGYHEGQDHHDYDKHDDKEKEKHNIADYVGGAATGAIARGGVGAAATGAIGLAARATAIGGVAYAAHEGAKAFANSFGEGGFDLIQRLRKSGVVEYKMFDKSKILDWEQVNQLSAEDLKTLLQTEEFSDEDNEKIRKLLQKKLGVSATPDYEAKKQNNMDYTDKQMEAENRARDEDTNNSMRQPKSIWEKITSVFEPSSQREHPTTARKAPERKQIEPSPSDQTLGSSTKQYESGSKGANAIGYDKAGGTSYGSYQIASNTGTMNAFLKHLEDTGKGDVASELRSAGPANTGGKGGAFVDKWQEMVNSGKLTSEDEHNFIQKTHYDPAATKAKELGFKIDDSGVKDAIWSGSVQHGGINKILERTAAKNPGFENMTSEDQIKAYYKERGAYAKESGVDQEDRYSREQQSVLAKSQYAKDHPTETAKAQIPTETAKAQIPTETAKAQIPTETAKAQIPTETAKAQIPTETAKVEQQQPKEELKTATLNAPTAITEKPNDFANLEKYAAQQAAGQPQRSVAAQASNSTNTGGSGSKMMNVRNDDPLLLTLQYGNIRTA